MSASLSTSAVTAVSAITGGTSSVLSSTRTITNGPAGVNQLPNINTNAALFREIHKNTWLKRLTADGKKITVGPKKSERSWVVFCVHDDCQALLEGYAEPRQAASHNPEWIVSMQETQHISHALIPNSHEFEFVVTLQNEVVRFHAMSWEVMQEWVETLRSKLREMKILSPRENLYTKLPEIRAPLLPTRDPTSPLPATPPVPAALVPGVERVVPQSVLQSVDETATINAAETSNSATNEGATSSTNNSAAHSSIIVPPAVTTQAHTSHPPTPALTSMSNTLTQNLINMLSNPITAYSELLQEADILRESNSSDADTISENGLVSEYNSHRELSAASSLGTKSNNFSNENVGTTENSVRLDISTFDRLSLDSSGTLEDLMQCERLIPRPQTSRSLSAGAADSERRQITSRTTTAPQKLKCAAKTSSNSNNNITELEIISVPYTALASTTTSMVAATSEATTTATKDSTTNITIIQVTNSNEQNQFNNTTNQTNLCSAADIFKFPENTETSTVINTKYEDFYKSNVQINPSSLNNSTIQVGEPNTVTAVANQYSTPIKRILPQKKQTNLDDTPVSSIGTSSTAISSPRSHLENHKITTVLVGSQSTITTPASIYGTCYNNSEVPSTAASSASPALKKKIILSANSSGVTNISVNNANIRTNDDLITIKSDSPDDSVKCNVGNVRYEKVFLSSSMPIAVKQEKTEAHTSANANLAHSSSRLAMSPKFASPHLQTETSSSSLKNERYVALNTSSLPSSPTTVAACSVSANKKQASIMQQSANAFRNNLKYAQSAASQEMDRSARSPALQRKRTPLTSATTNSTVVGAKTPPVPTRSRFLTRGLTEAVITARPSRKDFCSSKSALVNPKADNRSNATTSMNNNEEATKATSGNSTQTQQENSAITTRTRSESLEQRRRSSSTSEAQSHKTRATNNNEFLNNRIGPSAMRMQQPPHPVCTQPSAAVAGSSASKRMTLREQQVMQLRREIMHPGGVRLQLRRKDCIGSIAWVDAFGAVWVAGWKQKEHPVLYNALHIGDQLISIAGIAIGVAADANKVIRNTNTLFVEVLIRRIPLGRGYAIRREREGQCLGLIRDGNTSTIVDVVPNSLAAKHGLPPKAQSCDGSTLTFWVLTEINGRPLNLFFKENEIRDRLNSVGRDISILVQPSDLITKLKKQLKSMRGHKDYLVQ